MTPLDPDRTLALAYVPAPRRAGVEALWRLDLALGQVLATGREPMISRIRLAWWRETLEKLDQGRPPSEPVLEALAAHVLPAGLRGADLAVLAEGWEILLAPDPLNAADLHAYAEKRGEALFTLGARLLGAAAPPPPGGGAWALVDFARRSASADEAAAAIAAARAVPPAKWPSRLRPLGMLVRLARRDAARFPRPFEPQGAPARMVRMLAHRLTGN
jgi:15-cis-phytoene synthase